MEFKLRPLILVLRKLWSFKVIVWEFFWQSWVHNYSESRCVAVLRLSNMIVKKSRLVSTNGCRTWANLESDAELRIWVWNSLTNKCNIFVTLGLDYHRVDRSRDYGFVLEQNGVIGLGKSIQNTGEQLL